SSTANLPPLYRRNATGMQAAAKRGPPPVPPSRCARPLEKRRDGREGFVALLEHAGKEIETVRHALVNEMLDNRFAPGRAQLLREGTVVVNKRVGRAGGDEGGRIVAQVGSRRARVRVLPGLAVHEISAADEADGGSIIDDAKRGQALERLVLFEEKVRD